MSIFRFRLFSLLLVLCALPLAACENAADPEVRAVFDQIRTHMDVREGEKAVALLAPQSITQADQALGFARAGTRAQVGALNPADRAEVLCMRNRLSDAELNSFDGRAYLVHAVNSGWYARTSDTADVALGKIRAPANSASAEIILNGQVSNCTFNFDLIDDTWKLDWTGFDELFNHYVTSLAEEYGVPEDEILIDIEERRSGRMVSPSIWDR